MLIHLLLGCPDYVMDTDIPRDSGADTEPDDDADTDDTDDTGADTDPIDTGEPPAPFLPWLVTVEGAFGVQHDGTIGSMTVRGDEWKSAVWVRIYDERIVDSGDTKWMCDVALIPTEPLSLQTWTVTDTSGGSPYELVHHGIIVSADAAEISSDCPPEVDRNAVLAWDWGVGVGEMRADLVQELLAAGADPTDYYGGGAWLGDPAGPAYEAIDYGFGFEIDETGELVRDDDGYGVYLDPALVGHDVPGPGYYQLLGGFGLEASVLFP